MNYTEDDLSYFVNNVWTYDMKNNDGGMGSPDLFSLWFTLKQLKPKVVVESGVWNGISTKLIRKTLPDSKIICIDPRYVPQGGYVDLSENTKYYLGKDFKDFGDIDLSEYNTEDIFCFFDCHQNALKRVQQCQEKGIKYMFFNDNYPSKCGSHFSLQHLYSNDTRNYSPSEKEVNDFIDSVKVYYLFPNVYPGEIKTGEGYFDCSSFYDTNNKQYGVFEEERHKYRWNTFVSLK